MALPKATVFEAFGLRFTRYRFAAAGDELPLHQHDFDHLSLVDLGEVEVFDGAGPESRRIALDPEAQPLLFRAGRPHGLRALTAGAVVLNVGPKVSP